MIQIIGWLLCTMLFCFGVSIIGNSSFMETDEHGGKKLTGSASFACTVAIIAAFGFAFWLYEQGRPVRDYSYESYPVSSEDIQRDAAAAADAAAEASAAAADAMNDAR